MVELVTTHRVSRSELGWPASAAPSQASTKGTKVHYEGSPVHCATHADCVSEVKAIRKAHLANTKENYSDIAYNFLVCRHGYIFEGRGYGKRTGANGNQPLNKDHYAVCALLGDKGDTEPTPEMVEGIQEAIRGLRDHGAGKEIKGHRDGHATSCPGEPLYALVKNGSFEPSVSKPSPTPSPTPSPAPKPTPKPTPVYAPFPGATFFRTGRTSKLITEMGKRLVAEGYKGYKLGPGPTFTNSDKKAYAWWQRKLGYAGSAADGIPGPDSWRKLKVPKS